MIFKGPEIAPAHRRPPSVHEILHRPARSLRRAISLLSMFPAVAGVQPETSRSIKPRERDLGDLRLFFLVRILTRPTTILDMPPALQTISRNQYAPVSLEAIILARTLPVSTDKALPETHALAHNRAPARARLSDGTIMITITSTSTKAPRQTRPTRIVSGQIASFSSAEVPHVCSSCDSINSTGSRRLAAMKRWVADQVRR
jgi:hypothetical protein